MKWIAVFGSHWKHRGAEGGFFPPPTIKSIGWMKSNEKSRWLGHNGCALDGVLGKAALSSLVILQQQMCCYDNTVIILSSSSVHPISKVAVSLYLSSSSSSSLSLFILNVVGRCCFYHHRWIWLFSVLKNERVFESAKQTSLHRKNACVSPDVYEYTAGWASCPISVRPDIIRCQNMSYSSLSGPWLFNLKVRVGLIADIV